MAKTPKLKTGAPEPGDAMEVHHLLTSEIKPYPGNPRNNETAVEAVMKSIQDFGFRIPILVDDDMVLVAGHTRLAAAKRLGRMTVPAFLASGMTKSQIDAFRLVDNKTAELAEWNFDLLATEVAGLIEAGIDLTIYGWTSEELDCLREVVSTDTLDAVPVSEDGVNGATLGGRLGSTHITADARSVRVAVGEFNFFIGVVEYKEWAETVRKRNEYDKGRIILDLSARLDMRDLYEAHDRKKEAKDAKATGDRSGAQASQAAAKAPVVVRKMGDPKPGISSSPTSAARTRVPTKA